jgi:hypothetical protein
MAQGGSDPVRGFLMLIQLEKGTWVDLASIDAIEVVMHCVRIHARGASFTVDEPAGKRLSVYRDELAAQVNAAKTLKNPEPVEGPLISSQQQRELEDYWWKIAADQERNAEAKLKTYTATYRTDPLL